MRSSYRGNAVTAATLLASALVLSAIPSAAETPGLPQQQPQQGLSQLAKTETKTPVASEVDPATATGVVLEATDPAGTVANSTVSNAAFLVAPTNYTATAYSLNGKTASGRRVSKGLIAADPSVLPLGTRVRLDAGTYSGEYLVADTGTMVHGKRIDIWTPSGREAVRFGRRTVKLTVLAYGPRRHSARRPRVR